MKLTAEDFEAWREQPMTRLVLDRYLADQMKLTRETHDEAAWNSALGEERHASLRERYDTLEWIQELTFEQLNEWLMTASIEG